MPARTIATLLWPHGESGVGDQADGKRMKDALLHAIGVALDGLEVGYCAFDSADRTLAWNMTFLNLFPEHDGKVHVGESYAENLRRFYALRLAGDERAHIERYIAEGVARYRSQRRPYEFDHRDFRVRVSSFEMGRFGRVRVWRKVAHLPTMLTKPVSSTRMLAELNATAVLERLTHGVLIVDVADRVLWANQAFLTLYGLRSAQAAIGRSFRDIYLAAWAGREADGAFKSSMLTLAENQRFSGAEFELALPGERSIRVVEQRGEFDGRGYFEHVDITHLKRQQRALAEAEKRYRLLAEHSSDIILSVEDGAITYASPALKGLLGWDIADVHGRAIVQFCHPEDVPTIMAALAADSASGGQTEYRARALHREGSYVWVEARSGHLPGETGSLILRRVINLRGIAARKAMEEQLEQLQTELQELATTDPLTGLANRRKLEEVLALEFRRAQREHLPLSVLAVDIDHFKRFNDAHGHQVGDDVLRAVGAYLLSIIQRAGDLAARLGGEEFILLLPGTDKAQAAVLAEMIVRGVQNLELPSVASKVTVSIGLATHTRASAPPTAQDLLRLADEALYAAKRRGRNCVAMAPGRV